MEELGWKWKEPNEPGKLLGFPFAAGIDPEALLSFLKERVTKKMGYWNSFPLSLTGRILVANHLIASRLWYTLTLLSVSVASLMAIQKIVTSFVWGGGDHRARHRVQLQLICLPKHEGGLGLVDITYQAFAL